MISLIFSFSSAATITRRHKDALRQPRPKSTFELSSPRASPRASPRDDQRESGGGGGVNGNQNGGDESLERLRNGIDSLYNDCAASSITPQQQQQQQSPLLSRGNASGDSHQSSNNSYSYAESKFSTLDGRKSKGGNNSVVLRSGAANRAVSTPARRFSHTSGAVFGSPSPSINSANDRLDWLIGNSPVKSADGSVNGSLIGGLGSPLSSVPEVIPHPRSASSTSSHNQRHSSVSTSTPLRPIPTRPSQSSQSSSSGTPSSLPRAANNRSTSFYVQSAPAKDVSGVSSSPHPSYSHSGSNGGSPAIRTLNVARVKNDGVNGPPRGSSNDSLDSFGTPALRNTTPVIRPKLLTTTTPNENGGEGQNEEETDNSLASPAQLKGQPDPVEKNSIWYEYGCV